MVALNFDANAVQPAQSMEQLPKGEYVCVIENSDLKPTKNGNGYYVEITFTVIDGQYQNRKIWKNYNIDNPNPQAVEIAQRELRALMEAVGFIAQDTAQMHGKNVVVVMGSKKNEPDAIEVKGYKPYTQGCGQQSAAAPQQRYGGPQGQYQPHQATNGKPW